MKRFGENLSLVLGKTDAINYLRGAILPPRETEFSKQEGVFCNNSRLAIKAEIVWPIIRSPVAD